MVDWICCLVLLVPMKMALPVNLPIAIESLLIYCLIPNKCIHKTYEIIHPRVADLSQTTTMAELMWRGSCVTQHCAAMVWTMFNHYSSAFKNGIGSRSLQIISTIINNASRKLSHLDGYIQLWTDLKQQITVIWSLLIFEP